MELSIISLNHGHNQDTEEETQSLPVLHRSCESNTETFRLESRNRRVLKNRSEIAPQNVLRRRFDHKRNPVEKTARGLKGRTRSENRNGKAFQEQCFPAVLSGKWDSSSKFFEATVILSIDRT